MFGNFSLFKTAFPGRSSVPTSFVSFSVFYIFSYLFSKTMGYFSGCLMSSASIQKLFCGIYSAFKCSFDEFVGEKVVCPSYFSAILGPPPLPSSLFLFFISYSRRWIENYFVLIYVRQYSANIFYVLEYLMLV